MSNYIKTVNFATKDALPSGNAAKVVKGTEIDTEYNNIATAVATKQDTSGLGVANGYAPLDSGARVPVSNQHSTTAYTDVSNTFSLLQAFSQGVAVQGVANVPSAVINSAGGAGVALGPVIRGGTNSSDFALAVQNAAASVDYFRIIGNGALQFGSTSVNQTFNFLGTGNMLVGGAIGVAGGVTSAAGFNASGGVYAGSGSSLTNLPAGQLTGTVPGSVEGSGYSTGTAGTSALFLWAGTSAPTWSSLSFTNLNGQIANAQVPIGAVNQYQASLITRNISTKTGVSKTLQAGGTASGGSDGDIIYIY